MNRESTKRVGNHPGGCLWGSCIRQTPARRSIDETSAAAMGCASSKSPVGGSGSDSGASSAGDKLPTATPKKLPKTKADPLQTTYDDLAALGAGGFSVVRRVRHRDTLKTYAMKIISVKEDDGEKPGGKDEESGKEFMSVSEVQTEIDILRVLKAPSVLQLYETHWFQNKVYVVTEELSGGAVLDAILRMKDERYTEAEAKVVVQRTLQGMDYMHQNFVLHRDLKLENLLLRSSDDLGSVVIADFGLARRCQNASGAARLPHSTGVDTAPVGTPVFAAPEVVEQKSYGAAIDVWSLGVITYVLLTGAMPRGLWKTALKYGRVTQKDFGFDCYEWDTVSDAGREFVMLTLAYKPAHRLSASNALKHAWLKKVDSVRPAPLRIKSKLRDFAKGMKLPVKTYQPGDVLIKQGARANDDVFLIKAGSVEIVVSPEDAEGNIDRSQGKIVAVREPGEFIGEMALGASLIARNSSKIANGVSVKQRTQDILAKGPPKRSRGESLSLNSWISARIVAKKWIGGRRNADVIAKTPLQCLVMGRREMAWAIAADPDVGAELSKDMQKRRKELETAISMH